jgi:ABC-type phosphate transport system permease subunit
VQQQAPPSFIVQVVEEPTDEITIADVIFGSFGVVGALTLLALVLGAALAVIFVVWHRRHPPEANHMPPVAPLMPEAGAPPSARGR